MTFSTPPQQPAARRDAGTRRGAAGSGELEAAICEAAERLMATRPFAELSVADVIEEAGVSRASFYFYFGSKYALLARLAERISASVFGFGRAWFDGAGAGHARPELVEAVGGAFDTWTTHAAVLRALIESGPAGVETATLWEDLMRSFTDAATARIERDRASGAAPADRPDARTLAASLVWMTERALYLSISGGERAFDDRAHAVDALAEVWWRAIYEPA